MEDALNGTRAAADSTASAKGDPDMAESKSTTAPLPRQRAAGPRAQRASSSLLRLSQASAARLPSGPALMDWLRRAAVPLVTDTP